MYLHVHPGISTVGYRQSLPYTYTHLCNEHLPIIFYKFVCPHVSIACFMIFLIILHNSNFSCK
jgi:hypothetical protein